MSSTSPNPDNASSSADGPLSTSSHPSHLKPDPTTSAGPGNGAPQGGLAASTAAGPAQQSGAALKTRLKGALRQYQDFPSKGILFEDILPLFSDPSLHQDLISALELHVANSYGASQKPDVIVGLEARGFLFGPSLALRLGAGFVPVRKQGKLPGECETASYEKEYGQDFFQIQKGAIKQGQKVLIVDDIIATGETKFPCSSSQTRMLTSTRNRRLSGGGGKARRAGWRHSHRLRVYVGARLSQGTGKAGSTGLHTFIEPIERFELDHGTGD